MKVFEANKGTLGSDHIFKLVNKAVFLRDFIEVL
jgi:hypothetical protein